MKVTIYGPGCARCQQTAEVVQRVLTARGIPVELEKVSDYGAIVAAGIMADEKQENDALIRARAGNVLLDREIQVGVGQYDRRVLAAHLGLHRHASCGGRCGDAPAHSR